MKTRQAFYTFQNNTLVIDNLFSAAILVSTHTHILKFQCH